MKLIYRSVLIIFLNYFNLWGQETIPNPNEFNFKHLSSKEGLSQRSVTDIVQDKEGYLWFATRDGLNKYDGNKTIIYRHNSEDVNSLTHSWVTVMYQDTKQGLWIGTKDGLNKYNSEEDNFIQYKHTKNGNNIANDEIWGLTQLNDTTLCIGTNNGLDLLNLKNNKITSFEAETNFINGTLSGERVRALLKTSHGDLWICTIKGIDVFSSTNNTIVNYNYPKILGEDFHVNNSPTLFEDSHKNIWLGYKNGLAFFDKEQGAFVDYTIKNKPIINSHVRTICEDALGNFWVGTYRGLYTLNTKTQVVNHITHNKNNPKSLSQNSIYKIIKDSRGDMWIGTWAGGVNYFDRSYAVFNNIISDDGKNMLNYSVVSAIVEDASQNLWIGTEGGGLNYYDRKRSKFIYYVNDPNDKNSITSNNVKSIVKDHKENLWIGTHDGGLNFLNPNKKPLKFEVIKLNPLSNSDSEISYSILAVYQDKNKNIWIGTLNNGLFFYDIATKQLSKLSNGVKPFQCIVASEDPDFIITGGPDGIAKINIETKKQYTIQPINDSKNKKYLKKVNCVFVDDKGNYWIGTEGKGLLYFDKAKKQLTKYGVAEGLTNEVVYGILQDEKDYLWISTNGGLYQFNTVSKEFKNFDESYGLQGNEFNYGAYAKTSNKELIFGGADGITYFNPNKINKNTFVPLVDISDVRVNHNKVIKLTDTISKITLKHNQNDFSINFVALSFSHPNKNQYAYKLDGYDDDWNYVGNKKMATYTNIEDGNYVFRVKATNSDGAWNEKGDSVAITVKPSIWETWWAYLIYFLIFTGLILFIRTLILARIIAKKQLEHEKIEKEKIEGINKLKLKFFTNISHEFRTPLTLILGPLQRLIANPNHDKETKNSLELIKRNTTTLLELINQLLNFRKSEAGELKLLVSKNNIIDFVRKVKLSFTELAQRRNIKFRFIYEEEKIDVWFDALELKKVFINIFSNAFKFTPNDGEITVIAKTQGHNADSIVISIQDSGIGIPKEKINYIFDRYFQLGVNKGKRAGTGLGLSLAKDIIELHNGNIIVESVKQKGVTFTITLPLGEKHLNTDSIEVQNEKLNDEVLQYNSETSILENFDDKKEDTPKITNTSLASILLVEDNSQLRMFIKSIFVDRFNVFEANDGKEGIEIAQTKKIDLIISDIMMPIMNGIDMAHNIKSNIITSHIPIILLTAKASPEVQKEGFKIGADAYVTKPFDPEILSIQVNNLFKFRENAIKKFKKDTILTPKKQAYLSLDEKFLEKAFKIVEQHLGDNNFNAQKFTEKMAVSRTLLYNKLKALTGQSLTEFIRTVRLKKAAQLILNTDMNISEIAYDVGFGDLKYFRSNFKKIYNATPSKYRKDIKSK